MNKKSVKKFLDDKVKYASSIVLGLSDALVELTGALIGLTFALENSTLIATTGLVVGIAASLSMAGSEYLSVKEERRSRPLKSSIYTGITYIITVLLLVIPFFIFKNPRFASTIMLGIALLIIICYSFFISIMKKQSFKTKFFEMILITGGVSLISFVMGTLVRKYFGVNL